MGKTLFKRGDDPRSRTFRGRGLGIAPVVVGFLLMGLLILGGCFYLNYIQRSLWNRTVEDVLEVTSESAHSFEVFLDKDIKKLNILVEAVRPCKSTDIAEIVRHCAYFNGAQNIYGVINLDTGMLYVGYQEEGIKLPDEVLEKYREFPETGVREPYVGDYTGLKMIGYFQRIEFADGVPAMVYEGASVTSVAEQFTLSFFNNQGFSYVVNGEGDILIRPTSSTGSHGYANILSSLEDNPRNAQEDVDALREGLSQGKKGAVRLALGDTQSIFAFVPITGSDGWSMLTIIPDTVIMDVANDLVDASFFLGLIGVVGVIILGGYLVLTYAFRKRMRSQDLELHYREELFGVLVDSTREIFLMVRPPEFTVEYVSPNVENILGISPDEVRENLTVLSLEDQDSIRDKLKCLPAGMEYTCSGERTDRRTGAKLWFTDTIYGTEVDSASRLILVLSDRTDERQNEEVLKEALRVAEVANESKSTFLSNVSHDIRTPMNAIMGLCTLLKRDINRPDLLEDHIRKITASSQHMLGLLNDVLDMSKIESGKTTLSLSEFSLAEVADEVVTIARPQAKAKDQHFDLNVVGVRDDEVVGDKLRVIQVLNNLVSNAIKYTPAKGHILFEMRQLPSAQKNFSRIRFTVADDGMGMSPEFLEHVFDAFAREENSVTNKIQGTGLGLAITKNLVELMGGTVDVTSQVDVGSTFVVDLEFRFACNRDSREFFSDYGITRCLVVDDDPDICEEVTATMTEVGVETEFATDGTTAVAMVKEARDAGRPYKLMMVDWKMPEKDGATTIREIRSVMPEPVPIMVLTAYDRSDAEAACADSGVDGYLQKPFFLSSLTLLLEEMRSQREGSAPEEEASSGVEGCHFLAAEDNMLSASILEELLDMEGATVDLASNGQEALERFCACEPGTYDAILMDVQMPILDGYGATRAIRASDHPEARSIPIIAMTANAFVNDVNDALAAGMDMHMAKPVAIETLGDVLAEARAKRAAAQGDEG